MWKGLLGANPRRIGDRLVWAVRSNDLTHWSPHPSDNGPSSQIYIKFCQLLDQCKNILHPGITHDSISKEDLELFCCETFKCEFNMNKINKPMSVVSRFISQLGDIRIRIRIRIRILYWPIKDPQRGIAITMIDNMEYIHTMYIITTKKYW